jgi:hypothetical protein
MLKRRFLGVAACDARLVLCLPEAFMHRNDEHVLLVDCDADEAMHLHLVLIRQTVFAQEADCVLQYCDQTFLVMLHYDGSEMKSIIRIAFFVFL